MLGVTLIDLSHVVSSPLVAGMSLDTRMNLVFLALMIVRRKGAFVALCKTPSVMTPSSFQTSHTCARTCTHTHTHTHTHTLTHTHMHIRLHTHLTPGMSGLGPLQAKVVPVLTECLRTRSASSEQERDKWTELSEAVLLSLQGIPHRVHVGVLYIYIWLREGSPTPPHPLSLPSPLHPLSLPTLPSLPHSLSLPPLPSPFPLLPTEQSSRRWSSVAPTARRSCLSVHSCQLSSKQ